MGKQVNIGGDRLGSGNKMNVTLHGYNRSTHDLSYTWKNTQAPGTLVPFMKILALPGDTFDIDLNADVKTHPTVGPLFGSFKLQLDVFLCPIRLYNSLLHNNRLGVGMNMSQITFPILPLTADATDTTDNYPIDLQQISSSSLLAYLGIRGVCGKHETISSVSRDFNGLPLLMYWDIFKNYYANKQETNAYVIHNQIQTITACVFIGNQGSETVQIEGGAAGTNDQPMSSGELQITGTFLDIGSTLIMVNDSNSKYVLTDRFYTVYTNSARTLIVAKDPIGPSFQEKYVTNVSTDVTLAKVAPHLTSFALTNIDGMRDLILQNSTLSTFDISAHDLMPYNIYHTQLPNSANTANKYPQEGLAVKTYQSDIFNNWVSTDLIDGVNGIAAVTAVAIVDNQFTIDTLNLAKKVYDMLNRIAVSGGTYQDWVETVWDHDGFWKAETPIYCGGLSKEIVFQEVTSSAAVTEENPLGSLAGKGIMASKHKGGSIYIKVDEPAYIMGLVSITPRLDYTQGNDWDVSLSSMDDLHKPALDGIGFQDLITEQMAWWDTVQDAAGPILKFSAGKIPAWLNYMTNYNRAHGNFADPDNEGFMILGRKYEPDADSRIADLTTYIDPVKFNYAFAQTDLSAMNFWIQISNDITARRKMSDKIIPNL